MCFSYALLLNYCNAFPISPFESHPEHEVPHVTCWDEQYSVYDSQRVVDLYALPYVGAPGGHFWPLRSLSRPNPMNLIRNN